MTTRSHSKAVTAAPTTTPSIAPATNQAPSPVSPKTGIALVFLQPPPADAKIPTPPSGTEAPGGQHYRALVPKSTELATLAGAVDDLRRFTTFAQIFGVTGVPQPQVVQALDVADQWSTMRKATAAWDAYCQTQEGVAWYTVRAMLAKLKPVWQAATAADSSLAVTYPNLAAFLGAKKAIGQRAASTRRLNKQAVAEGKEPVHGVVGVRRQRKAAKAALAALAAQKGGGAGTATSTVQQGVVAAPVVADAAPVVPATGTAKA